MHNLPQVASGRVHDWYLVCLNPGSTAVVAREDLYELVASGSVIPAISVSAEAGRQFEEMRARTGYMSATCRLKSGESDRVG
jgi:hypothetical protein